MTIRAREGHTRGVASSSGSAGEASDDDDSELVCTGEHPFFVNNRGAFVPASSLAIGDQLSLADQAEAVLVDVTVEDAPAGETFTTYNFEVAEWHTYFAGSPGAWVHNLADRACERLRDLYHRCLAHGDKPRRAVERILSQTKANGRALVLMMRDCMVDIYRTAVERLPNGEVLVHLDDIPTVKQVNTLLVKQKGKELRFSRRGAKYSGSVLEVHHTVMGHVIDDFLGTSKFAEGMPSLLRADKVTSRDDALAWVLTQREHVGNGFDIHKYVDAELAALGPRPYRNIDDVRDALVNAYRRAGDDGVPGAYDVMEAVKAWLNDVKLP